MNDPAPTAHRCTMFQFSPPGSFEHIYRCTECSKPRETTWTAEGNGNAEDRAARIPIGHM